MMTDTIKRLIAEHGTPFYLFDEAGFCRNYRALERTFQAIYPAYRLSYSYKTNYTPYICQLVRRLGGYAEVVSDMEYTLARRLGYDNSHIVYNGPSKGEEMYEHLDGGGILNIDSLDEARRVAAHCRRHPSRAYTCGLRVNMDLGGTFISRFGLVVGSGEMEQTVGLLRATPNLRLIGLHCHISRSRGLEAWRRRAAIMLAAADRYIPGVPAYISLGSGMYADMEETLRRQFGGDAVPTYADYAEAAIRPFAEHYKEVSPKPLLFTEPGTTVVARYVSFASRVVSIKEVRGRQIANMDGDYHNLGEVCTMKQLPVSVIAGGQTQRAYPNMDVMGFTCLEQDVMYPAFRQPVAEGDVLVFGNVGGYSIVAKPQFIKPQCAMYALRADGGVGQIMRAETFDDVFSKFVF